MMGARLMPVGRSRGRLLAEIAAVAVVYAVTARLGLLLAMPGGHATPVWPPSGIALAALLLRGWGVAPGVWLGNFVANAWDFFAAPNSPPAALLASATIASGSTAAALAGEWFARRFAGGQMPHGKLRDVCVFLGLAGVVSCAVGATVGVTTLCGGGFKPWSAAGQLWLTWWLGDTAGVFVFAPLLLAWSAPEVIQRRGSRWEFAICCLMLIAVAYVVFIANASHEPIAFTMLPLLAWPAIRFGPRGAATAVVVVAVVAVWGTTHGTGPFDAGTLNESLLLLELFLSTCVITGLCIAAVMVEREGAEAGRLQVLGGLEATVRERTDALTHANANLQTQVAERSRADTAVQQLLAETERARRALLSILEDQRRAEAALRALTQRLLQAEDEERRRIAKELHDSTAQDLVAVMMNLSLLQDSPGEKTTERLADSQALLENCAHEIRTLSYLLHPPMLDDTGLVGAFREYAAGFSQRTGIAVNVEAPPDLGRQSQASEIALFRVVQESLGNVLRHSRSTSASIRVALAAGHIVLEVADAGCGLPSGALPRGVGISGMRERLQRLGGRLELDSSRAGTTVRGILPLEEACS